MKTYHVTTLARTECVQATSVDESDPHVVRFLLERGKVKAFGRGSLISYQEAKSEDPPAANEVAMSAEGATAEPMRGNG